MTEHDSTTLGHETADADIGPLIKFAVFLALTTFVCAALCVGLYRYLDQREIREKAGRYPLAAGLARPLPPTPRLQTYPFDDIKAFRGDGYLWWQVAEYGYDTFMIRNRAKM